MNQNGNYLQPLLRQSSTLTPPRKHLPHYARLDVSTWPSRHSGFASTNIMLLNLWKVKGRPLPRAGCGRKGYNVTRLGEVKSKTLAPPPWHLTSGFVQTKSTGERGPNLNRFQTRIKKCKGAKDYNKKKGKGYHFKNCERKLQETLWIFHLKCSCASKKTWNANVSLHSPDFSFIWSHTLSHTHTCKILNH